MTSPPGGSPAEGDAARVFARLLEEEDQGRVADPRAVAAQHPGFASELLEGLAMLREIDAAVADAGIGRVIGDFRLLAEIGRGGMGVVYQAEQISLGRSVALKILTHGAQLDTRQVQRFQNEARAAGQLDHPHIVPVYAVGDDDGTPYYAMRLIDGRSLRDLLSETRGQRGSRTGTGRPVPPADGDPETTPSDSVAWFRLVAGWLAGVAEALERSHQAGILHRDVKPGNILIDRQGHPWITDFGLASFRQDDSDLTVSGEVLGTLAYCSPEQASGRHRVVDQRSDVYSLGVTMYELLTGRRPHESADRAELVHQIAQVMPRSPRRIDPRIPADLETITCRAMAKMPEHRYQSAAEFAQDLRAFLENRPIRARPVGPVDRCWRWCRRNPALAAATAVAALLAFVVFGVGYAAYAATIQRDRAQVAEGRSRILEELAGARADLAESTPQDRRRALARVERATAAFDGLRSTQTDRTGLAFEMRQIAVDALCRRDAIPRTIDPLPVETTGQAATRDGACDETFRYFARVLQDRSLWVSDSAGAATPWNTGLRSKSFWLAGEAVLSLGLDHRLSRLDIPTRRLVFASPEGLEITCLQLVGKRYYAFDAQSRLYAGTVDRTDWPAGIRFTGAAGEPLPRVRQLAVSEDDTRVACVQAGATVTIHRRDGTHLLDLPHEDQVRCVAWHPRGMLAVGGHDGRIQLWSTALDKVIATAEGHSSVVISLCFDPQRPLLVSQSWDNTTRLWHAEDLWPELVFRDTANRLVRVDGGCLGPLHAEGSDTERLYDVDTGVCSRRFAQRGVLHSRTPVSAVDPDERVLAFATWSGVTFFDLATGRLLHHVEAGRDPNSLCWTSATELYMGAVDGVWRIEPERGPDGSITGGRSRRIQPGTRRTIVATGAAKELLIASGGRLSVLDPGSGSRRALQSTAHATEQLAVSPDGRFAAGDAWDQDGGVVWDLRSGEVVHRIPNLRCRLGFDPRGRLWVAQPDLVRVLAPGSFEEVTRLETPGAGFAPSMFAFSPDGTMVAITRERIKLELRRLEDLSLITRLEVPSRPTLFFPRFSQSGRWLSVGTRRRFLQAWDLQEIRRHLHRLGLHWGR